MEADRPVWTALGRAADGRIAQVDLTEDGTVLATASVDLEGLAEAVAAHEAAVRPRWVLPDVRTWYPRLLAAGVTLERCLDLRLVHRILRHSQLVADVRALRAATAWDTPVDPAPEVERGGEALFDLDPSAARDQGVPHDIDEVLAELGRQREALDGARDPGRLRLLAAAESAGALIAAELQAAGIPWDVAEHDRILTAALGPRPAAGSPPARMVEVGAEVRAALGDPQLSLESPPRLLRALHRAGIDVRSTSQWELQEQEHPAIEPLLRYKKMSRLLTANGWAWIDEWVHEGRYRPVYVPGGVVTGRWASSGGGALQIPRQLRPALRADPGWMLVSADVSQLEPRVLAAMAADEAMITAGAGRDLYAGIVDAGIVATRQEAKVGVLGALYGGTTGDSGRVVPRLRQRFPAAMALVDGAAATGERGGTVTTWLGRSSPAPEQEWTRAQAEAHGADAPAGEGERARRAARDRGRFTRNFVVQGTAAEWALSWMAGLRLALSRFEEVPAERAASASGPVFARRPHLAFFLHDEVIVHAPAEQAEAAAAAIRESAQAAGRLLFPGSPIDFPLDLEISERSAQK
ncbi:bifunctional 3'-5' exonuclease/DNA polymerase [Brachybacterium sp. J153]|uniref:bifunctional 3'-5' exonuclease/DNA polymerase n=1 Tax=Brachybacterium sp. J153 TaxID=3116488 RepID=UPI002E760754|nr:bifunctional 3'-5' exonuclease/DNA polymerase [Brachybacterium sp. J153]MEE1617525.1 bifunctional 3'-5' exonuclease/DNA polymerase [Brachybacterium sp. J153]